MADITLPHNFQPRHYQLPLLKALDSGIKRALVVWHRRCGKDLTFLNIVAKKAAERKGNYNYYLPTLEDARKIIWQGQNADGFDFLKYFPADFIKKKNERDLRIEFVNGSAFQLLGTDQLNVVGAGPVGCVFSEYSLQNPQAWPLIQPILRENGGWALFNGTPRGYNHMYNMYKRRKNDPKWFTELLTIDDTNAYSVEDIKDDIKMEEMTWEKAQQEYWCSFNIGIEGSYYSKYLVIADKEGRTGDVEFDPRRPVYTAWDLGIDNAMAIWFFQTKEGSREVDIVDHYEKQNEGLKHYADMLADKSDKLGYDYGAHFAPWDVAKRDLVTGLSVQRNAEKIGIYFDKVKRTASVMDDIEIVRRKFQYFHFSPKCEYGVNCLRLYHAKKDEKMSTEIRPVFLKTPVHDWTSNTADALRTLARAIELHQVNPKPYAKIGHAGSTMSKDVAYSYLDNDNKPKPSLRSRFGNHEIPRKDNYL